MSLCCKYPPRPTSTKFVMIASYGMKKTLKGSKYYCKILWGQNSPERYVLSAYGPVCSKFFFDIQRTAGWQQVSLEVSGS